MTSTPGAFNTYDPPCTETGICFASLFRCEVVRHYAEALGDVAALPLMIKTTSEQWAYTVEWPRTSTSISTPVAITVTLRVLDGAVAVGILTPEGDAFVDQSVVDAGTH